jgi:DNA-binding CsgD family transcriptional regulator
MFVTSQESRALSRLFGLLAEDMAAREVRERVGGDLLDLLAADYFASFVWDDCSWRFGDGVLLNMSPDSLARYDSYYQDCDPITLKLQARRVPTLVNQVMAQRELMRTEFFNDFLARDGLHWGVNVYCFAGESNIGDLRIWRGRRRENFDHRTLELLRLVEPAFTSALVRAQGRRDGAIDAPPCAKLSAREYEIAEMIAKGLPDKVIAERLGIRFSTVRTYCERIFAKLAVDRRSAVASKLVK